MLVRHGHSAYELVPNTQRLTLNQCILFIAWSIWRKPCSYPRCESLCPVDSGCFNHDITSQYEFTVICRDAYGSDVTDTFELFIDDNSPPYLTTNSKNSTGTLSLKQISFGFEYRRRYGKICISSDRGNLNSARSQGLNIIPNVY